MYFYNYLKFVQDTEEPELENPITLIPTTETGTANIITEGT